ncbi:phage holin family protein [Ammonicoccus fulvus]|uniref:Phage holin family protein n=1 Tax=Ammonicoccus fulvus TaxID=3138240 RepID=A0ABZ3FT80_9ACTN
MQTLIRMVPGITVTGAGFGRQALTLLIVAAIIGVVNSIVKPIVATLTGCLIVLTLGLFIWVVNAWMLLAASWIAGQVSLGFHVDGFWSALFGSIVISVVTMLLSGFKRDKQSAR